MRVVRRRRSYTTLEYALPRAPCLPPAHLFVVDTCIDESEMAQVKSALQQALSLLPEASLVGLITYGTQARAAPAPPPRPRPAPQAQPLSARLPTMHTLLQQSGPAPVLCSAFSVRGERGRTSRGSRAGRGERLRGGQGCAHGCHAG